MRRAPAFKPQMRYYWMPSGVAEFQPETKGSDIFTIVALTEGSRGSAPRADPVRGEHMPIESPQPHEGPREREATRCEGMRT